MNDIGLFRAELDVEPDYLNTKFYLDFELYFSDLQSLGGPEKWQNSINEFENKTQFKQVSKQTFKISKLAQSMAEFVPVVFEDQYFCVLNCYV